MAQSPIPPYGCISLLEEKAFIPPDHLAIPITPAMIPQPPLAIRIDATLTTVQGAQSMFRYGTDWIAGQGGVENGVLWIDFRQTLVPNMPWGGGEQTVPGGRSFGVPITPGRHSILLSYDGVKMQLILDGALAAEASGAVDLSRVDGHFWIGRNGPATDPGYFMGTMHSMDLCNGMNQTDENRCYTLIRERYYRGNEYSQFPILGALYPSLPVAVHADLSVSSTSGGGWMSQMLWRYGTSSISGMGDIQYGLMETDFRRGTPDGGGQTPGNRALTASIAPGRHHVVSAYDGNRAELHIDGALRDSATGSVDLTQFDGAFWVARNGFASDPVYLTGMMHNLKVCHQMPAPPDAVAPQTAATPYPAANAGGWNKTDVQVSLKATDNPGGSGVKLIRWIIEGPPGTGWQTATGSEAVVSLSSEGVHVLRYQAIDHAGNEEAPKTLVVRMDKTAPGFACPADPSTLWPPNGKMIPVRVDARLTDALSGPGGFVLLSATSSQPDPGAIEGFLPGSASVSGALRAARTGAGAREYRLTYRGSDQAGNTATCTATVIVPHDQRP
jgi:hypothetical protein